MIPQLLRNPGRPLTPAEHVWIRRQLILIPVYISLFLGWQSLIFRLPLNIPGLDVHVVRDFVHFYVQGVVAVEHDVRALYDMEALAAIVPRVVPDAGEMRFPPVYGPQVAVFFSPLARLPYNAALFTWLAISLAVYLACAWLVLQRCPRLQDRRGSVFLLLIGAPALLFDLRFSQASAIALACVTAAFVALDNKRPFLAGLAIGSLFYKPPLGIAAAFIFVAAGEWVLVAGAVVAVLAQVAVGCAYWGPAILVDYVGALRRLPEVAAGMEPFKFHMHSWRALFQLLGLPEAVATTAHVVMSVGTLRIATTCWRSRAPLAVRFSGLLLATVLVDPHIYVYDLIILTPALLILWDWTLGEPDRTLGTVSFLPGSWQPVARGKVLVRLLYLGYFAPLLGAFASLVPVHFSVLVLATLLLAVTERRPATPQVIISS